MRALYKVGKAKRAIVCKKEHENFILDPAYWGIVFDVKPFMPLALQIQWVNRGISWSNGDDLLVVYHGVSEGDLKVMLDAYNKLHQ